MTRSLSHGITPRELEIIERNERRMPPEEIAEELGLSRGTVEGIVHRYRDTGHDPWKVEARHGSAMLLLALRRAFPGLGQGGPA